MKDFRPLRLGPMTLKAGRGVLTLRATDIPASSNDPMTSDVDEDGPSVQTIFVASAGTDGTGAVPVIRQLVTSDAVFRLSPDNRESNDFWNEATPSFRSCDVTSSRLIPTCSRAATSASA